MTTLSVTFATTVGLEIFVDICLSFCPRSTVTIQNTHITEVWHKVVRRRSNGWLLRVYDPSMTQIYTLWDSMIRYFFSPSPWAVPRTQQWRWCFIGIGTAGFVLWLFVLIQIQTHDHWQKPQNEVVTTQTDMSLSTEAIPEVDGTYRFLREEIVTCVHVTYRHHDVKQKTCGHMNFEYTHKKPGNPIHMTDKTTFSSS